jgi:hypothetical protein
LRGQHLAAPEFAGLPPAPGTVQWLAWLRNEQLLDALT